jgi:predicted helicase
MQRGVFYTPRPVVSYIVRSVHEVLQTKFGLSDGLASTVTWGEMAAKNAGLKIPDGISSEEPFVVILDPATGTATFLVEAIDVIQQTLAAKWSQQRLTDTQRRAAWNEYVPKHLLPRLYGYELMMAPYAIAHMKIGLKLYETGYRFGSDERARIYLTNSLEPPSDAKKQREFEEWAPALAHEARAVNEVKRRQRFTVVIGNPPYSNFGQLNKIPFILGLLEDYKRGLEERKINLDDDFIKFVRFAQWCIGSASYGIFGFITNNIYLDGATHRQMRRCLAEAYSHLYVVDLHGDGRKKLKGPTDKTDENVFDIIQGVSISIFVRAPEPGAAHLIFTKGLFGPRSDSIDGKYEWLLAHSAINTDWTATELQFPDYFFATKDLTFQQEYLAAPSITEILSIMWSGIQTKRDALSVEWGKEEAWGKVTRAEKMKSADLIREFELPEDGRDWKAGLAIKDLHDSGPDKRLIIEFAYRPLDTRYLYYTGRTKGWIAYPRKEASDHLLRVPNVALIVKRSRMINVDYFCHVFVVDQPPDINYLADQTYFMPLFSATETEDSLFGKRRREHHEYSKTHNLSPQIVERFAERLKLRFIADEVGDLQATFGPHSIFYYIYAVLHSPGYRTRYSEFLKIDFPRLPLPLNVELFREVARLGFELVSLHLLKSSKLDNRENQYVGPAGPEVEKVSYSRGAVWLNKAETCGFSDVFEDVWNFHVGGYQVCEKWLKDRKGRRLSKDDIAQYQKLLVSLRETVRIMAEIDSVIDVHGGWPTAFASTQNSK